MLEYSFAVGTPVSRRPPRRSQHAGLPHWAPASGQGQRRWPAPMQPRALYTQARHSVRCVFCEIAFPLAHPLPSIPSAGGRHCHRPSFSRPLFRDFAGTMGQSDSLVRTSMACAYWLPTAAPMGRTQGLPVLAHGAYTHARGLSVRPRQVPLHLAIPWCSEYGLRLRKQPRHLEIELDFAAQYPAYVCSCQRFGHVLAGVST